MITYYNDFAIKHLVTRKKSPVSCIDISKVKITPASPAVMNDHFIKTSGIYLSCYTLLVILGDKIWNLVQTEIKKSSFLYI